MRVAELSPRATPTALRLGIKEDFCQVSVPATGSVCSTLTWETFKGRGLLTPLPSNPPSPVTESETLKLSYIAQLDGNNSIVSESEEIAPIKKGRGKRDKLTSA